MADVLTDIEGYLQTMAATATGGAVFTNMHEKSNSKPYTQLEVMEGEPDLTLDAVTYANCQANAQFFVYGDSKNQVRTAINAIKFMGEPLPSNWTGVILVDIKPGAPDQPWEDTSVKGLFIGAINLIIDFRQSYV